MKILTALLIGAIAGLLGALCGVGGGIVMVPAFTAALGLEHKNAIATSLAIIVITALVATLNNARPASLVQIDWRIVAIAAVGAALASWYGTDLMHQLRSPLLTKIFAITLIIFGVKMLISK
ncbi:MAG: TSUP family transporter [Akkermansiaceae bacterium]